jgi:alanyl-tRNA synthetase
MDREEAERRYGFRLYEGGIPPGKKLRIVKMGDFDVEACAGTHVNNTGEIGFIKIINAERIADGVERLEFAAGKAALKHIQVREQYLFDACNVFSVRPEQLPKTATRFFEEWKEQGKEITKLRQQGASGTDQSARMVGNVKVVAVKNAAGPQELVAMAAGLIKGERTVAVLLGQTNATSILIARSPDVNVHCGDILKKVSMKIGVKGGGKADFAQGGGPPGIDAMAAIDTVMKEIEVALGK